MRSVRSDIQGLRAIAVLSVILFHVNKDWLPGGFVGVDVFFVISGYLIGSIIIDQKKRGVFSFRRFYFSRIRRIIPAYLVVIVLSALAFAVLLIPADYARFSESVKSAALFYSNAFFAKQADYFAPAGHETPLIHTWSLAVEMQFYVFLPIILIFLPTRVLRPALFAIIAVGLSYSTYKLGQGFRQQEYYSLFARAPEFLVGSLIAIFPSWRDKGKLLRELLAIVGLILIAACFWFINEKSPFPGWLAVFPTLGAFLIIGTERSILNSALSNPLLVRIGDLSYSLYLWHWPILAAIRYYSESYQLTGAELGLFFALVVGLAVFSYRYVEAPFRRGEGDVLVFSRLALLSVAASLSVWGGVWINENLVQPLPVELTRYADPEVICHEKIVGECLRGDLSSKRSVLMVGDSHAAQLNHFADVVGSEAGVRIRVITSSSCVTISGFDWDRLPNWAQRTCKAHIEHAERYADEVDFVIIAGMWQYHVASERFLKVFESFVKSSAAKGKRVIVLAQVPMLSSNVQRAHRFESLGIRSRDAAIHPEWRAANEVIRKLVEGIPGSSFVDLSNEAIFSSPPFHEGGLIYRDDSHLNEIGSAKLGHYASETFVKLLNNGWVDGQISSVETLK